MKRLIICISLLYSIPLFPQSLTKEQVKADIDSVISVLSTIHPTFNRSSGEQTLKSIRDTISNGLSGHDLFRIIQPVISVDGHTTLQFNGEVLPNVENPLLPFETVIFDNKLYIKNNLTDNDILVRGMEIIAINGMLVSVILDKIISFIPGEKLEYKVRKLDNDAFANWFRLVYGNHDKFEIRYNYNGNINSTIVNGAHWNQFQKQRPKPLEFTIVNESIAYLKVGKFIHPNIFLPFIDSAFAELKSQNISNLIIDKTQGGGFSILADSLLSYITNKPYYEFEKKEVRISKATEDYIQEIKDQGKQNGAYFVVPKLMKAPYSPNTFEGGVYILTGPRAYSAATLFVAMAKCYSDAIIVGEETGQPLISNGDISRYQLPNSDMKLYTSHAIYYLPCAENKHCGVKPDIEVKMTLDDLLNDKNVYLDYTIKLIQQRHNK